VLLPFTTFAPCYAMPFRSKFESIKKNILPCEPLKKFLEFTSAFFDVLKTPDDQLVAKVLKLKETLVNLTKTSENPKKNIN